MENIQTKAGAQRPAKRSLDVLLARSQTEILDAQRLRHQVRSRLDVRFERQRRAQLVAGHGADEDLVVLGMYVAPALRQVDRG